MKVFGGWILDQEIPLKNLKKVIRYILRNKWIIIILLIVVMLNLVYSN